MAATWKAIGCLVVLAASLVASCSSVPPEPTRAASDPNSPPVTAHAEPSHTVAAERRFCRGALAAEVRNELSHRWRQRWPESVIPFERLRSDATVAAAVYGPAFSGVALVDASSGRILRGIDAFGDPGDDQAGGQYDGRTLVWKEYHSQQGLADYTVKAWNARTGKVRVIGQAHRASDGHTFPSPWQDPVLGGGYAAWVEATDDQGAGDIVLYDTRHHRRQVVHRGHPGWLLIADDKLIWAEAPRPGAMTEIRAIGLHTKRRVAPPAALAALRGVWGFVSDGRGYAWVGSDSRSVYFAKAASQPGRLMVRLRQGGFSPPLVLDSGVVAAPISAGGLVLGNGRHGTLTELRGAANAVVVDNHLLLVPANPAKAEHPVSALAELSPSDVQITGCR